jgi:hypothetical protein
MTHFLLCGIMALKHCLIFVEANHTRWCCHEQVIFLKQLKRDTPEEDGAYLALEKDLLEQHPKHLPLLSARLANTSSLSSAWGAKKSEVHHLSGLHIAHPVHTPDCFAGSLSDLYCLD